MNKHVLAAALAAALLPQEASADKLNAAYVNDQPAPFGGLTAAVTADYGATSFNRFNMMGLSLKLENGMPGANPIWFGGAQPLAADWSVPAAMQDAGVTIAALKANGAEVFATLLGPYDSDIPYLGALDATPITADATICGPGGSGTGNVNCTIFYLDKFLQAYGFDGFDIDIEGGNPTDFRVLMAGIGNNPDFIQRYGLSFAPYQDDAAGGRGVLDGACSFQAQGITDYLDARQYYAGGAGAMLPGHGTQILQDAAAHTCPDGKMLDLGAQRYVLGISPYSVLGARFPGRGGPNNCQYYYDEGFPDCADLVRQVVTAEPEIAGTFVWTISLLDWHYYSCYIGNALEGTDNDCGTPKPVPQDQ